MEHVCRTRLVLTAATLAALLSPVAANATLYEMKWGYKWGQGDIIFDGSVQDSNPAPNRGEYLGSIQSYTLLGWTNTMDYVRLSGHSGSISVVNHGPAIPGCEEFGGECPGELAALTIHLGSATPPYDPAGWHLSLSVPWNLGNFFDSLPAAGFCNTLPPGECPYYSKYELLGWLDPNTPNGQVFVPIIFPVDASVTLMALAVPVPEPGTIPLLGLALAMLAFRKIPGSTLRGRLSAQFGAVSSGRAQDVASYRSTRVSAGSHDSAQR